MVYYILSVLFLLFVWCPCMAINVVSLQYNGGLLPDGIFPLLRHLAPPPNTNDNIEQSPAQGRGLTIN